VVEGAPWVGMSTSSSQQITQDIVGGLRVNAVVVSSAMSIYIPVCVVTRESCATPRYRKYAGFSRGPCILRCFETLLVSLLSLPVSWPELPEWGERRLHRLQKFSHRVVLPTLRGAFRDHRLEKT
jgi:hypothetical protein